MRVSEKPQLQVMEASKMELEGDNWVVAGVQLRTPLRPILVSFGSDKRKRRYSAAQDDKSDGEEDCCSTTHTSEESKIPALKTCPLPPRKRKPPPSCSFGGTALEFFCPPDDLETVFIRRHGASLREGDDGCNKKPNQSIELCQKMTNIRIYGQRMR